jgi:hypothetical protein
MIEDVAHVELHEKAEPGLAQFNWQYLTLFGINMTGGLIIIGEIKG